MVATPIGNLDDITFRAVETLKSVDLIACEDTRHSLKLLNHFGIQNNLISCRSQNELKASEKIIEALKTGDVAFISDAGTPGISDPGARLADEVRKAGFTITPIPGASALTALMSVAPIVGRGFTFVGFLSPKQGKRKKALQEYMNRNEASVFYESPFRIIKLLNDIADIDSTRELVLGRELTKCYEEIIADSAQNLLEVFQKREKIKGEFIILVSGRKKS